MSEINCPNCEDKGELSGIACQACCPHEFDWEEGYTCLNCGEQGDIGGLIDSVYDSMRDG